MASAVARVILPRLIPGQPRLNHDEWVGCRYSFAQVGEDRLLINFLQGLRERGEYIYVDVGAHDPIFYSNTLLLHKAGWSGINIDASEAAIERFRAQRPGDRNVWAAVSDDCRPVVYYRYPSPACNRILAPEDLDLVNALGEEPVGSIRMTTRTLNDLLAESMRPVERIGLLNIDCEGEDFKILQALDWDRWRPFLVAVESHSRDTTADMCRHLAEHGYVLVGQLLMTLIFCDPTVPVERGGSNHPIVRHSVAAGPGDVYQPT
jgi:FkbM family methyltransferase